MNAKLQSAVDILMEFMADVQAAGLDKTKEDWPDLYDTYRHADLFMNPMDKSTYKCDDCQRQFKSKDVERWLAEIPDLNARLDAGGVVPDCECPFCGALAYKVKRKKKRDKPCRKTSRKTNKKP